MVDPLLAVCVLALKVQLVRVSNVHKCREATLLEAYPFRRTFRYEQCTISEEAVLLETKPVSPVILTCTQARLTRSNRLGELWVTQNDDKLLRARFLFWMNE